MLKHTAGGRGTPRKNKRGGAYADAERVVATSFDSVQGQCRLEQDVARSERCGLEFAAPGPASDVHRTLRLPGARVASREKTGHAMVPIDGDGGDEAGRRASAAGIAGSHRGYTVQQ